METKISKNGKRMARKHGKKIDFRLSQERLKAITADAARKHCSVSDVLRTAAEKYLIKEKLKEIIPENLLKEFNMSALIVINALIDNLPEKMRDLKEITAKNLMLKQLIMEHIDRGSDGGGTTG
jgi:hypothetical protein